MIFIGQVKCHENHFCWASHKMPYLEKSQQRMHFTNAGCEIEMG